MNGLPVWSKKLARNILNTVVAEMEVQNDNVL